MNHKERRDFIKKAVIGGLGIILPYGVAGKDSAQSFTENQEKINRTSGPRKKVIVGGAGISWFCCAYELMKKGHEVIVLEASGRYGGAVLSVHDGLSADFGEENFTKPGYENY